MKRFGLADLNPPPGTRAAGWYAVAPDIGFPMWICRGNRPGPSLLLTAGVHGDEYDGPSALQALYQKLEPARIRGRVTAIPVVHWLAWQQRARTDTAHGLDLNRCFRSGSPSGQHAVDLLIETILSKFIAATDVVMDFHSGGLRLRHLPLAGWYGLKPNSEGEEIARRFHSNFHPWRVPDADGVLTHEAHRLGKLSVGFEWGGGGSLDLSGSSAIVIGIQRVMHYLQMLEGGSELIERDARPAIAGDYQTVTHEGFFHPATTLGQMVEKGQILGELFGFEGGAVHPVRAETSGKLAGIAHLPWLHCGDRVAYIG